MSSGSLKLEIENALIELDEKISVKVSVKADIASDAKLVINVNYFEENPCKKEPLELSWEIQGDIVFEYIEYKPAIPGNYRP